MVGLGVHAGSTSPRRTMPARKPDRRNVAHNRNLLELTPNQLSQNGLNPKCFLHQIQPKLHFGPSSVCTPFLHHAGYRLLLKRIGGPVNYVCEALPCHKANVVISQF